MTTAETGRTRTLDDLLEDFSLEMTGRDVPQLGEARGHVPAGSRVHITYLASETTHLRIRAAGAVRAAGLVPIPHVAARRLRSAAELEKLLTGLEAFGAGERLFVVGGDPATPEGPYPDALSVLDAAPLRRHGVREVYVAGYPEGHPDIPTAALWSALAAKDAALRSRGWAGGIVTQFGFDADAVLGYLDAVRARGIDRPIRVGVPGPAGVKRLLGYARRFGIGTSAGIAKKYGLSLTSLVGTAGPERFLSALAEGYEPDRHGRAKLHFYAFGGLAATSEWVREFREGADR